MFETISRVEVASYLKGSEKGSCGYAVAERVTRENVGALLSGVGDLMSIQAEMASSLLCFLFARSVSRFFMTLGLAPHI